MLFCFHQPVVSRTACAAMGTCLQHLLPTVSWRFPLESECPPSRASLPSQTRFAVISFPSQRRQSSVGSTPHP